jgi:hypothetical protein
MELVTRTRDVRTTRDVSLGYEAGIMIVSSCLCVADPNQFCRAHLQLVIVHHVPHRVGVARSMLCEMSMAIADFDGLTGSGSAVHGPALHWCTQSADGKYLPFNTVDNGRSAKLDIPQNWSKGKPSTGLRVPGEGIWLEAYSWQ